MNILVIKTSSMGDLIHTLPAITDAISARPDLQFDWVAEKSFAAIPALHTNVSQIIPVKLRQWRKNPIAALQSGEPQLFLKTLRAHHYDAIIDAQGLLKSALIALCAHGKRYGLDATSAREPLAALFYHTRFHNDKNQHAILRVRTLFAHALGYTENNQKPHYGIDKEKLTTETLQFNRNTPHVMFIHGTSRANKCWPVSHWIELGQRANKDGFSVIIPWGNEEERLRSEDIARHLDDAHVLKKTGLQALAAHINACKKVIAVDTGLGHLSAALSVPTTSLYGPTDPARIGTQGDNQTHIIAPNNDLTALNAERVWSI